MSHFFGKKGRVSIVLGAFLLIFWAVPGVVFAQNGPEKPSGFRQISDSDWQKATGNLDYSSDLPDADKPEKSLEFPKNTGPGFDFGAFSRILQLVFIFLGAIMIAWIVYHFMLGPRSKRLKAEGLLEISAIENSDDQLLGGDLERLLSEAVAAGQFSLAIRLHYLLIIMELSRNNFIIWKREKTNRDYLNELAPSGHGPEFRKITGIFERIWYGEEAVEAVRFGSIEPQFQAFLTKLRPNK